MQTLREAGWLDAARLDGLGPTLVFHAREKLAATLLRGGFKLLSALEHHASQHGWGTEVVQYTAEGQAQAIRQGGHLHIFMEDRPVYAPNAIACVPSYLRGFWYFDELASRNNSSIRLRRFDPRLVAPKYADRMRKKLVEQFVTANFSKFRQAERGEAIPTGCVAFFAQDFKPPRHHRHFLTVPELLEAAIAARGARPIVIKPHPNNTVAEREALLSLHAPTSGIHVTDASIHDILAACDCVVTVSSAVAFEGFLHRKPAVLAGQTDFHHNAITVTRADALVAAMAETMARDWPYAAYLTWFLRQNCVEDHPRALPEILRVIEGKGISIGPTRGFY